MPFKRDFFEILKKHFRLPYTTIEKPLVELKCLKNKVQEFEEENSTLKDELEQRSEENRKLKKEAEAREEEM